MTSYETVVVSDFGGVTYKPSTLISEGGFGSVWNLQPSSKSGTGAYVCKFALERDSLVSEIKTHSYVERHVKRLGEKLKNYIRIPCVVGEGVCTIKEKPVQYMIMEKFGKDLSSIRKFEFSSELNRVFAIIRAGLTILKGLYAMHVYFQLVHGDIKPQNFLFKTDRPEDCTTDSLVFIDLGLTRPVRRENIATSGINGTRSFASIHVHKKYLPTPRCDIESLCYVLLQFIDHQLPWNKRLKELFPKRKLSEAEAAVEKSRKEKFVLSEKRALKERISEGRFASQGELILSDVFYAVFHMPSVPEPKTYKALCKHFYRTLRDLQRLNSEKNHHA